MRSSGEQIVLDIVLYGKGTVTGIVRDLAGAPVPDAQVYAASDTDPRLVGQAGTDGDGRYTIGNLLVGAIGVRALKGQAMGSGATRIPRAGATVALDVTLNTGAVCILGTVSKVEGGSVTPAAGVSVVYRLLDPAFPGGLRTAV